MTRVFAKITIQCDAVTGRDALGDIYCKCYARGVGDSMEAAALEATRNAKSAGWKLVAEIGVDLCRRHVRHHELGRLRTQQSKVAP